MKRGEGRIFAWNPLSWGVRRSSDGLWQWNKNQPILPWFAYKKGERPNTCSVKLGEYMFFLWWTGDFPLSLRNAALRLFCKLSFGRYKIVERRDK